MAIVDADYVLTAESIREALRSGCELDSVEKRRALLVVIDACERLTALKAEVAAGVDLGDLQTAVAAETVPAVVSEPTRDGDGGGY
jgi:hypothetical protein